MHQSSTIDSRIETLRQYLVQDPENLNLLAEISDLSLAAGRPIDAREAALKGLESRPADPFFLLRLSSAAIGEKSFEESLGVTQSLLRAGHSNPAVIYNHAYALVCLGRFEEARDLLNQQAQLDSAAVRLLIRCHHYLGEMEEAIGVATHYLSAFPEDAEIAGMLSLLYADTDQLAPAGELAAKALANMPHHMDALLATGAVALAQENADEAVNAANRALEVQPRNGRAWMILGLAGLLRLDPTSALPALKKATEYQPQHIGTWHLLGWTQLMLGDMAGAEESFQQALSIDDNFGESHGAMATIAALKGEWEIAESEAKVARRLDPDAMSAYYPRLIAAQQQGRPEVAAGIVERALRRGTAPKGGSLAEMVQRVRSSLKK